MYVPSEDTMLLLGYIEKHVGGGETACDLGCGSGILSLGLAGKFDRVVAVDINRRACEITWGNFKNQGYDSKVDLICGDSLSAVREGEIFDIVVSNPPYLPVEDGEPAWSGGSSGVEIPIRFVLDASRRIRPSGSIIVLLSTVGDISRFIRNMRALNLEATELARKNVGLFEELLLFVVRRSM